MKELENIEKKISVILPCYNVASLIDRTLHSIEVQTIGLEYLEIICVDDCSTDDTVKHLCEWEEKYPQNFIIVKCDVNGRQGKARNIGLKYASADWIGFIDSDDWIEPDYFERLFAAAKETDYDIICCGYDRDFSKEYSLYADKRSGDYKDYIVNSADERRPYIVYPPLGYSAWAKLIRKDFLTENELYFPANVTYEDAVWGSLAHIYFKSARMLSDKLYHYFVNDSSTVLTSNSFHHFDSITAQTILWNEYEKRGFFEIYPEELEMEHIFSACLPAIKASIFRFDPPNYNMYLLIREIMAGRIGNYKDNSYIKNGALSEIHQLIMQSIDNCLSKEDYLNMAAMIKKVGL